MLKWLKDFWDTTKETTETIIQIGVVASMLGGIGVIVSKWYNPQNLLQIISFYIFIGGLLIILVALIFNLRRKRDIEKIPDKIEELDVLVSTWLDDFELNLTIEQWAKLNSDYSSLFGIDLTGLEKALKENKSDKDIEKAYNSVSNAYARKLNPDNILGETLNDLGDMASILDTYEVGFDRIKSTSQYQKLDKKIRDLQRKAPSAYISMKVNDYYTISERLYTIILGAKPLSDNPLLMARMPAKVKAKKSQLRPIVDNQIANLIAGVREAILKHKERNIPKPSNNSSAEIKEQPLSRAQRRKRG